MSAPAEPVGTVSVVDPNPLNWLFITWNTMEEPVRIDEDGRTVFACCESAEWVDGTTLELKVRGGVRFQDGQELTAHDIKRNFDEVQRWTAPHPPGTWLNFHPDTVATVVDEHTLRLRFPEPDGLAVGKFRGMHIASRAFWDGPDAPGFGYAHYGSGEGHW